MSGRDPLKKKIESHVCDGGGGRGLLGEKGPGGVAVTKLNRCPWIFSCTENHSAMVFTLDMTSCQQGGTDPVPSLSGRSTVMSMIGLFFFFSLAICVHCSHI